MANARWILAAIATATLFVTGCAAVPPTYVPTVHTLGEGALVSGWRQRWPFLQVVLIAVDGHIRRGWDAWTTAPLLIAPGMRTLKVHGVYFGYFLLPHKGDAAVELRVELKAGQPYELQVERNGQSLTFWIENAVSHEVISERMTQEAIITPIIGGPGMGFSR